MVDTNVYLVSFYGFTVLCSAQQITTCVTSQTCTLRYRIYIHVNFTKLFFIEVVSTNLYSKQQVQETQND